MALEPILSGRGLVKRFGGLIATDHADIDVLPGEVCALIGPNGAGKTTIVGLLTGEIALDEGAVLFEGRDITRLPTHERAQRGLARSFQITSIFPELTVIENVSLAVQIQAGHSFSFFRATGSDPRLREPAAAFLDQVGLASRANDVAEILSHGEHRRLEIAVTLACRPKVLLLDEPMAGLGPDDCRRIIALLEGLKGRYSILLIEHDMNAVFALADRISVLVYGQVVANGSPAEIRESAEVRAAYLGEEEAAL